MILKTFTDFIEKKGKSSNAGQKDHLCGQGHELAINQSPTSKAAIEKAKRVQTQYPCAGQTSRQLCHSRGYPAERAHNSDYVKLSDGSCICAPCLAGFTGVYCEQVDVCLARTSETFCSGHGKPVIDNGECRCSPCFHAEGTHGYHGDQCKKRACNSSDIFSSGPSSATRGKSGNSISIPADCTELKLYACCQLLLFFDVVACAVRASLSLSM